MRINPLITALGLLGLFAASMLVGYLGGQAFLAPAKSAPRTARVTTPPPVVETPSTPAAPLGPSRQPENSPPPAQSAPTSPPGAAVSPSKPKTSTPPGQPVIGYRVQAGAFQRRENAEARMEKLKRDGYEPYIVTSGDLFRVIVGAFNNRENADRLMAELRGRGYDALVLPVR